MHRRCLKRQLTASRRHVFEATCDVPADDYEKTRYGITGACVLIPRCELVTPWRGGLPRIAAYVVSVAWYRAAQASRSLMNSPATARRRSRLGLGKSKSPFGEAFLGFYADRLGCYCPACQQAWADKFGGEIPRSPFPDSKAKRQFILWRIRRWNEVHAEMKDALNEHHRVRAVHMCVSSLWISSKFFLVFQEQVLVLFVKMIVYPSNP